MRGAKWYQCTTVGHSKLASLEGETSHEITWMGICHNREFCLLPKSYCIPSHPCKLPWKILMKNELVLDLKRAVPVKKRESRI
jgi:hypothetical protein